MLFSEAILIDTSAIIALFDKKDEFHQEANYFFNNSANNFWAVINSTTHEVYTRARYNINHNTAIEAYSFLTDETIFYQLRFTKADENESFKLLTKYSDQELSFHDTLCTSIMKKFGIYRIFSFDHHFYYFGFEILPGTTRKKRKYY